MGNTWRPSAESLDIHEKASKEIYEKASKAQGQAQARTTGINSNFQEINTNIYVFLKFKKKTENASKIPKINI